MAEGSDGVPGQGPPHDEHMTGAGPVAAAGEGRRATNLELFLDLAFVFAVAQLAGLFAADLTPAGFGRAFVLTWLVWWLWSQFVWLGTAIDLDRPGSSARLLILAAVPPTLLLGVAIPGAYGDTAVQFAAAYLVVQLWAIGIQGRGLWADPVTRRAWFSYAPGAALAPLLVLIGAFLSGDARVALWVLAGLVDLGASLLAGREFADGAREWTIDPGHFAERHGLFVIIALGEVLVACGVAASGATLDPVVGVAIVAAVAVACVYWWTYFGFVASAVEGALARAGGAARGRVARDLCTYGHFPIVFGIALYSIVAKHTVLAPTEALHGADLAVLALSVLLVVGGFMGLHAQVARAVAPERPVAVVVVLVAVGLAGPLVPAAVLVAAVALVLGIMQLVTARRVLGLRRDAA